MLRHVELYVLLVLCIAVFGTVLHELYSPHGALTVSFLDVGQGDAIFIVSPTGNTVLIDGGPDGLVLSRLGSVMPWFGHHINLVAGTHPDGDHVTGLGLVLQRMQVEKVIYSEVAHDAPGAEVFESSLKKFKSSGGELLHPQAGDVFDLGGGAVLKILFPFHEVTEVKDTNETSLVAQVVYGKSAILFTGDAPQFIEDDLSVMFGSQIESVVLKLGHHGSRTSSSELFLRTVKPQYGIISRGCENTYGHPHAETLELLKKLKIQMLDTCVEGTITFSTDGVNIWRR